MPNEVKATGTDGTPVSDPLNTPLRAGVLPSLKMITPDAPAAWAFAIFWLNVHVPRWMSAIRPATNPLKSEGAQPLVDPPGDGMRIPPAGCRSAVAVPMLLPGFQSVTIV